MEQLDNIEMLVEHRKKIDTNVSKSPVEWHLDHVLKTINGICDRLKESDPKSFKSNFNFTRSMVYLTGIIPRGAAQAPKSVTPPDIILEEDLFAQTKKARENMKQVLLLDKNANFKHPYFNLLNRDQTLHFIEIHTKHHLKIIKDILSSEKPNPMK